MTGHSLVTSAFIRIATLLALVVTLLVGGAQPGVAALGDRVAVLQNALLPPVAPDTDFGEEVAIDGNLAVVAAPSVGGNDGAVYVYERDAAGRWTVIAGLRPDDTATTTFFGRGLAIDGTSVAVGATYIDGANDIGAVYVFTLGESGFTQQQKIADPDLTDDGGFGKELALQGDTLLATSINVNVVHAFERSGTSWTHKGQLTPVAEPAGTSYGADLDLDGDVAVVTNYDLTTGGVVHVFARGVTGQWTESATVEPPPAISGTSAGKVDGVALSGSTLAIGLSVRDTTLNNATGAVAIFVHSGSTWTYDTEVVGSTVLSADGFPGELDLHGDVLAVAARTPLTGSSEDVFVFDGSDGWSESVLSSNQVDDGFGTAVATDGSRVLVGALLRDVSGPFTDPRVDQGAAMLFAQDSGGSWAQEKVLVGQEAETASELGNTVVLDSGRAYVHAGSILGGAGNYDSEVNVFVPGLDGTWRWQRAVSLTSRTDSLAVDGTRMVVGAAISSGAVTTSGSVHVLEWSAGEWSETAEIFPTSNATQNGKFGEVVGVSGDRIVVGAPGQALTDWGSGRVYVYEHDGANWVETELEPPLGESRNSWGTQVAISGDVIAIGTGGLTDTVDVYRYGTGVWAHEAALMPSGDDVGRSLALEDTRLVVGAPDSMFGGDAPGQVFVYDYTVGSWDLTQTLTSDQSHVDDRFGAAVALDGDILVVGEPGRDDGARTDVGGFSYFTLDGTWDVDAVYVPAGVPGDTQAGLAVAVAGEDVVLGAPQMFDPLRDTSSASGGAYAVRVTAEPVAVDDDYATAVNTPLTVLVGDGVLVNDVDPGGGVLTAALVDDVSHGTLSLNADGSFTYTPDTGWFGIDAFTYEASTATPATSNVATVTIAVSRPPVATDDDYGTGEGIELTVTAATGLLANDSDPDGDALEVDAGSVIQPADGSVTVNADGSFTYTPDGSFTGPDSFQYAVTDGVSTSAPATVTIDVSARPTAVADAYVTDEDVTLVVPAVDGVLDNDTDDDPLGAILDTAPAHGTVDLDADGGFTYVPDADYEGPDTFTYVATDGAGTSDPATVTLTVRPVADPEPDVYDVDEGTTLTVPVGTGVLANDTVEGGGALTAALATDATGGILALDTDGSFTYTPDAGTASDSFTYRAETADTASAPATVTIDVNRAPTAAADVYEVTSGESLVVAAPGVLGNDGDADSDALTVTVDADVAHGTLTLDPDWAFTYVSDAEFVGSDAFTYEVTDGRLTATATATITVTAVVNDPDPDPDPDPVAPTLPGADGLTRCAGADRIATAVCTSELTFATAAKTAGRTPAIVAPADRIPAGAVVLARSDDFADALAGTPFAYAQQAPLLLTTTSSLSPATRTEIDRVLGGTGTVWLLGGNAAISADVATELTAAGYRVERLSGPNRYETAVAIAEQTTADPTAVFVTTGSNFADAVSAGPAAIALGGTIVLSAGDTAVGATQDYLAGLTGVPVYAIGGPAARAHPTATRVAGSDRIATAIAVAEQFFTAPPAVGIARLDQFADALSGGAHIGRHGGPLLLTATTFLPDPVTAYLGSNAPSIDDAFVYGGEKAVSPEVAAAVEAAIAD